MYFNAVCWFQKQSNLFSHICGLPFHHPPTHFNHFLNIATILPGFPVTVDGFRKPSMLWINYHALNHLPGPVNAHERMRKPIKKVLSLRASLPEGIFIRRTSWYILSHVLSTVATTNATFNYQRGHNTFQPQFLRRWRRWVMKSF